MKRREFLRAGAVAVGERLGERGRSGPGGRRCPGQGSFSPEVRTSFRHVQALRRDDLTAQLNFAAEQALRLGKTAA
jgi:hypothetical protein